MFYVNLGNKGQYDRFGNYSSYGLDNTSFIDAATGSTISFFNVKENRYWYDEEYTNYPGYAWGFDNLLGLQDHFLLRGYYSSWAVADGDIVRLDFKCSYPCSCLAIRLSPAWLDRSKTQKVIITSICPSQANLKNHITYYLWSRPGY